MKEEKEWSEEVVALAHKIHSLNNLIDSYKNEMVLSEGRLRKLRNENTKLKSQIGLLHLKIKQYEEEKDKYRSSNDLGFGEFEEIS